jgi:hypothetical protein
MKAYVFGSVHMFVECKISELFYLQYKMCEALCSRILGSFA